MWLYINWIHHHPLKSNTKTTMGDRTGGRLMQHNIIAKNAKSPMLSSAMLPRYTKLKTILIYVSFFILSSNFQKFHCAYHWLFMNIFCLTALLNRVKAWSILNCWKCILRFLKQTKGKVHYLRQICVQCNPLKSNTKTTMGDRTGGRLMQHNIIAKNAKISYVVIRYDTLN